MAGIIGSRRWLDLLCPWLDYWLLFSFLLTSRFVLECLVLAFPSRKMGRRYELFVMVVLEGFAVVAVSVSSGPKGPSAGPAAVAAGVWF